jgi:hypothetical protein
MKGKKKSSILEGAIRETGVPVELEARMADLEHRQGRPEPFIGLSYSTRLWTFYMFDLMGITLMRRSAAAATRKRSSSGSVTEDSLPSTEILRHALRRANALEPTKAN